MSKVEVRELLGPPQIEGDTLWRYLSPRRGDPANPLPNEVEFHLDKAVRVGPGFLLMRAGQPITREELGSPDGFLESGDAVYERESLRVGRGEPRTFELRAFRKEELLTWSQVQEHQACLVRQYNALRIATRVSQWLEENPGQPRADELEAAVHKLMAAHAHREELEDLAASLQRLFREITGREVT